MKNIYFTVGPSQLYPTVGKHIQIALKEDILSISHRGQQFKDLYKQTEENLCKLMSIPNSHHIFFTGSSIESMERIIQNTVYKHSFHIISGEFGKKFYQFAELSKKQSSAETLDPKKISKLETIKILKNTELIAITQNDTSTGIAIPFKEIYQVKKQNPNALIAIDIVSSAPYGKIDFANIDMAFFSVQKGFGLPAGIGVLIVNDAAIEKAEWIAKRGGVIGPFRAFPILREKEKQWQTVETPNVMFIYLLNEITKEFLEKGPNKIQKETDEKAQTLYSYFDSHKLYKPYITDQTYRSPTSLVIDVKGQTRVIIEKLKKNGMIVGSGYGKFREDHIRIANFPAHHYSNVKHLLQLMD